MEEKAKEASTASKTSIDTLPDELILGIINHLNDIKDILSFCLANHRFYTLCCDNDYWQKKFKTHFPAHFEKTEKTKPAETSWFSQFAATFKGHYASCSVDQKKLFYYLNENNEAALAELLKNSPINKDNLFTWTDASERDIFKNWKENGKNQNIADLLYKTLTPLFFYNNPDTPDGVIPFDENATFFSKDKKIYHPLHFAIILNQRDEILPLIEKGADVYPPGNIEREFSPLECAIMYENSDAVEILLEKGASTRPTRNFNPFYTACFYTDKTIATHLLKYGSDINERHGYNTPLIRAVGENNISTVQWLLEQDANVNTTDANNRTALFFAAFYNRTDCAKQLLDHPKIDTNIVSDNSAMPGTPLFIASFLGHTEIVKLLLQNEDIDCELPNSFDKKTPRDIALQQKHFSIAAMLGLCEYIQLVERQKKNPSFKPAKKYALSAAKALRDAVLCERDIPARFLTVLTDNTTGVYPYVKEICNHLPENTALAPLKAKLALSKEVEPKVTLTL